MLPTAPPMIAQEVNPPYINSRPIKVWMAVILLLSLMMVGFYIGITWLQNSLSEIIIAIQELKDEMHNSIDNKS